MTIIVSCFCLLSSLGIKSQLVSSVKSLTYLKQSMGFILLPSALVAVATTQPTLP